MCASLALIPSQDDFREKYAELDTLPKINNLVYDGAVVPMWTDTTGFVYVTREADGLKYFHVDAASKSRTEITSPSTMSFCRLCLSVPEGNGPVPIRSCPLTDAIWPF